MVDSRIFLTEEREAESFEEKSEDLENAGDLPDREAANIPPMPGFHRGDNLKVTTWNEWDNIINFEKTEKFLTEANIEWKKTEVRVKEIVRGASGAKKVTFICRLRDGGIKMRAQLKLPQKHYIDFKNEVLAYAIGKKIGILLPPLVIRRLQRSDFERIIDPLFLDVEGLIEWEGVGKRWVKGSLRYWIEAFNPGVIGARPADEGYLIEIARALHPFNLEELKSYYPQYLEIGKGLVYDFLINNNDRARNIGTVVLPDGTVKVIFFDQGLAFSSDIRNSRKSFLYFEAMHLLPLDIVENLKNFSREELRILLFSMGVSDGKWTYKLIDGVLKRRDEIVHKANNLKVKWGERAFY